MSKVYVKFRLVTQSEYNGLSEPRNSDILYFTSDTNKIYRGDNLLSDVDLSNYLLKTFEDLSEKETLHDEDLLVINDSEDENSVKKVKISSLPSGGEDNVIEEIQVNGVTQTPSDKVVNLELQASDIAYGDSTVGQVLDDIETVLDELLGE